jgi:hypothetical protein
VYTFAEPLPWQGHSRTFTTIENPGIIFLVRCVLEWRDTYPKLGSKAEDWRSTFTFYCTSIMGIYPKWVVGRKGREGEKRGISTRQGGRIFEEGASGGDGKEPSFALVIGSAPFYFT